MMSLGGIEGGVFWGIASGVKGVIAHMAGRWCVEMRRIC